MGIQCAVKARQREIERARFQYSDPVLQYSSTRDYSHYSARPDPRMQNHEDDDNEAPLSGEEAQTPNLGPAWPRIFTV